MCLYARVQQYDSLNLLYLILEEMRKNVVSPFIELLWEIVSDSGSDPTICWNENGTSFQIVNPVIFAEEILNKHFKHTNVSSFVRQLNMYNFHKNKGNTKTLEFYHKLFRRDAREILPGIKRKPSQADFQEGEEMLRKFLAKKYTDSKPESEQDQTKEELLEQYQSQLPHRHIVNRKQSSFTDQLQKPQITFIEEITVSPPKKILNIILIAKPLAELQ